MSASSKVREQLSHPVIDGDGHWLESVPIFLDYLGDVGGPRMVDEFRAITARRSRWYEVTDDERARLRLIRQTWWGEPAETYDRATATLPALMYERLGEFGIDFGLIYPTLGLKTRTLADADMRSAACRALNIMAAEAFAPYGDRMVAVATIPSETPGEAIEELEYAVRTLGLKVAMTSCNTVRFMEFDGVRREYVDTFGLDSIYDYDPMWAKYVELGLPVTDHGGSVGWTERQSYSNYVFNHVGHFAAGLHASCRAIFLGGVTRRFPDLRFAFLEGGVGWATSLVLDLVGHWEKRNLAAMHANLRPANLDRSRFASLFERYASGRFVGRFDDVFDSLSPFTPGIDQQTLTEREGAFGTDDFAAAAVDSPEEILAEFRRAFYFGCEADDSMTSVAFSDQLGAKLRPLFSSDIGHFDVIRMDEVLEEAWELVEHGLIDEEQFKEFTFTNSMHLHTSMNPRFFEGTAIADAVAAEIAQPAATG